MFASLNQSDLWASSSWLASLPWKQSITSRLVGFLMFLKSPTKASKNLVRFLGSEFLNIQLMSRWWCLVISLASVISFALLSAAEAAALASFVSVSNAFFFETNSLSSFLAASSFLLACATLDPNYKLQRLILKNVLTFSILFSKLFWAGFHSSQASFMVEAARSALSWFSCFSWIKVSISSWTDSSSSQSINKNKKVRI